MTRWTLADMPSQAGRTALVTGSTSGIGLETAVALAGAGAAVVVSGRDEARGRAAVERIMGSGGQAVFERADLSSLTGTADLAGRVAARHSRLDLLVCNAAVMAVPTRRLTTDGLEMQMGVNVLAHFALMARLMPALLAAPAPRVVMVSSLAHRGARLDLDDLGSERRYTPFAAYGASKLAMLVLALELQRRSQAAGLALKGMAAHPGFTYTRLHRTGSRIGRGASWYDGLADAAWSAIAQGAARGALPTLRAATDPALPGGSYLGPDGLGEMRGWPVPARIAEAACDGGVARRLWEAAERLTGQSIRLPAS